VTDADLVAGKMTPNVRELIKFETERARAYYADAQRLFPYVHAPGRPTLTIMIRIYRGILRSIEKQNYDVFSRRARVSTPKKLGIVANAWFRAKVTPHKR